MEFLEKLWKILENIEILNLSQQKEETICCHRKKSYGFRTKLSYYKAFYRKFISNKNEKKKTEILMNKPVHL